MADKSEIKSTLKNTDTAVEERTNSSFDNVPLSSEEGLAKIREIRAERIPKERDTSIGKKCDKLNRKPNKQNKELD